MENDWTREIDRLRAENRQLAAELATAKERLIVREAWVQIQVARLQKAKRGE